MLDRLARSPRWRLCVSFAALFVLIGCGGQKAPSLTVGAARLTETSDEAIALGVSVHMSNPNPRELELRDFKYRVSVDGRSVYTGRRSAEATLPAQGSKRIELPAVVRFDQMGWSPGSLPPEAAYSISGTLTYVAPGQIAELLFDTGVRKPKASFSRTAKLPLAPSAATP